MEGHPMIDNGGVVGLVKSLGKTVVTVHVHLAITGAPILIACGMIIGLNAGLVATHPSNATVSDEISTDDINLTAASEKGVDKSLARGSQFGPLTQDGVGVSDQYLRGYLTAIVSHGLSFTVGIADVVGPAAYSTKSWVPTVVYKATGFASVVVGFVPALWYNLRSISEVMS